MTTTIFYGAWPCVVLFLAGCATPAPYTEAQFLAEHPYVGQYPMLDNGHYVVRFSNGGAETSLMIVAYADLYTMDIMGKIQTVPKDVVVSIDAVSWKPGEAPMRPAVRLAPGEAPYPPAASQQLRPFEDAYPLAKEPGKTVADEIRKANE